MTQVNPNMFYKVDAFDIIFSAARGFGYEFSCLRADLMLVVYKT